MLSPERPYPAEYQISFPSGDQASPDSAFSSAVSVLLFPDRSTTASVPRLSKRLGWSKFATSEASRETRGCVIQPMDSYFSLPIGNPSRQRPSPSRPTSRSLAWADQSPPG